MMRIVLGLICLAGASPRARAEVALAPLFADHAVLQRGKPVPVWGRAAPGERIAVSFAGQSRSVSAGPDGRWLVELAPLAASARGADLVVVGANTLTIHDVVVGEVWLCSGQSNMELTVKESRDAAREIAAANDPLIRVIKIKHAVSAAPKETAATTGWHLASPQTAGVFTAVGYFFAREISLQLGVSVGIVDSSWGGTPVEAWINPEALESDPRFAIVGERWRQTLAEYSANQAVYAAAKALRAKSEAAAMAEGPEAHALWLTQNQRLRDPADPARWLSFGVASLRSPVPRTRGDSATPAGLFNGMINPVVPYGFRGVLWYQGEKNAERPEEYLALFSALITGWRSHFGQGDLPFYWVNLANLAFEDATRRKWAFLREAQTKALALPATGQALAIDVGEAGNIHPGDKQDVGHRLALLAENRLYGLPREDTGPTYRSAVRAGRELRIEFQHARGLSARGKSVGWLEVAGADRIFYPAEGRIVGAALFAGSPAVPEPAAVRYAWVNAPGANLYNGAGLPAVPFRSDDW